MGAEIRGFREQNMRLFNAMRADLTDLRSRVDNGFAEMSDRFAEVSDRFAEVYGGFAEMRGKLDASAAGQEQIVRLLNTLISQDDDS